MPIATLVAAASFACVSPAHATGATIRCEGRGPAMALAGIAAIPPSAPCRRFSDCPIDPGTAARDHLAELTRGQKVSCTSVAAPRGPRTKPLVRCAVAGRDLSCAMLDDGEATAAGAPLDCPPPAAASPGAAASRGAERVAALPMLGRWVPAWLLLVNIITYLAFAADRRRLRSGLNRVASVHLLGLVAFGGGIGALVAQARLDHLRDEQPFVTWLVIILGLQLGIAAGLLALS